MLPYPWEHHKFVAKIILESEVEVWHYSTKTKRLGTCYFLMANFELMQHNQDEGL